MRRAAQALGMSNTHLRASVRTASRSCACSGSRSTSALSCCFHSPCVSSKCRIITSTQGTFVYVVDKDMTAKEVPVQRVHAFGDNAAVTGLAGTEQVITEGKQNLRAGGKVVLPGQGGREGRGNGARGAKGAPA